MDIGDWATLVNTLLTLLQMYIDMRERNKAENLKSKGKRDKRKSKNKRHK